jgi:hypothetical protein
MKKIHLITFVSLFVFSACSSPNENQVRNIKFVEPKQVDLPPKSQFVDTLRVTGVSKGSWGYTYVQLKCVDKNANECVLAFDINLAAMTDAAFTERGDTIIMKGNEFVKNLTQERIKNEFIHH